ncbi:MAG: cell division protein FtsL [Bacillus sp. (in: firmicutes)]
MSTLARNVSVEQQHGQQTQKKIKTLVVRKNKVTLGEKILYVLFALVLVSFSTVIISNQYEIYALNKEIQGLDNSVAEQVQLNNDLNVEVGELSSYERILEKAAELGLTLNENNVKVVED